jgi:hypothetical protein
MRKNIKNILELSSLQDSAKQAKLHEQERLKRLKEARKEYVQQYPKSLKKFKLDSTINLISSSSY